MIESSQSKFAAKFAAQPGTLYLVATPIGNLGDLTFRALEILRTADLVLAEDTRSFSRLREHYGMSAKAESYHEHNERARTPQMIERLKNGSSIALTTDAGTPLVSDPGYHLVNAAHAAGVPVVSLPGACAVICALALSGFEPHRFTFCGFLPPKPGKRRSALEEALAAEGTTIFFESPHRLMKTLAELKELAPERTIAVARELTKIHEECVRGSAVEVFETFNQREKILGEIVLLIRPAGRKSG